MSWEKIDEKHLNQSFRGHAEECTYEFSVNKPDQLGARWDAQSLLQAHIQELQDRGEIVLEYELWEDRTPTWRTDYSCRITASASPLPWGVIIVAVLIIAIIFATYMVIKKVKDIAEYLGPGGAIAIGVIGAIAVITIFTVLGIYLIKRPAAPRSPPKPRSKEA